LLRLAKGATLKGAPKVSKYPEVRPVSIRSYGDQYPGRSLIYAEGKKNIGLIGEGIIDGNGLSLDFVLNSDDKPFGIRFISCRNVLYEGITLKNSGFWMMHNLNCDSLTIRNITIVNHSYGNNDGINIDGCRKVLVEHCNVDSNNDPVVIKTMSIDAPAEDIVVRNCVFGTYSRAIKVGTETYAPVRNVHVHDCTVKYSTKGPLGSALPGKCGILLSVVDGGSLDNITVENIDIRGVSTPVFIRLGDRGNTYADSIPPLPVGALKNVRLENITADAASGITSSISGIPVHPVENIVLKNISLTLPGGGKAVAEGTFIPENAGGKPEHDMFGEILPSYGWFIRHVNGLTLDNVCVTLRDADERPELYFEDTVQIRQVACGVVTALHERSDLSLKIYPNPSQDAFYLVLPAEMNTAIVECRDITGRLIWRRSAYSGQQRVDWKAEPAGVYFIQATDHTGKSAMARIIRK